MTIQRSYSSSELPSSRSYRTDKAMVDARTQDIRLGFHKSVTPLGQVFHHMGSFTPMAQISPKAMNQGHVGPWRSFGTWWESLQKKQECQENIFRDDEIVSRYWPLGQDVCKIHGSLEPEHFFMGHRRAGKTSSPSTGSSSNGRWLVKNAYVEKVNDFPRGRYMK